jgi:hypothetical protein
MKFRNRQHASLIGMSHESHPGATIGASVPTVKVPGSREDLEALKGLGHQVISFLHFKISSQLWPSTF